MHTFARTQTHKHINTCGGGEDHEDRLPAAFDVIDTRKHHLGKASDYELSDLHSLKSGHEQMKTSQGTVIIELVSIVWSTRMERQQVRKNHDDSVDLRNDHQSCKIAARDASAFSSTFTQN